MVDINREAFPNVNLDKVEIHVAYPGATPSEIERLVIIPIEQELKSVDGIDSIRLRRAVGGGSRRSAPGPAGRSGGERDRRGDDPHPAPGGGGAALPAGAQAPGRPHQGRAPQSARGGQGHRPGRSQGQVGAHQGRIQRSAGRGRLGPAHQRSRPDPTSGRRGPGQRDLGGGPRLLRHRARLSGHPPRTLRGRAGGEDLPGLLPLRPPPLGGAHQQRPGGIGPGVLLPDPFPAPFGGHDHHLGVAHRLLYRPLRPLPLRHHPQPHLHARFHHRPGDVGGRRHHRRREHHLSHGAGHGAARGGGGGGGGTHRPGDRHRPHHHRRLPAHVVHERHHRKIHRRHPGGGHLPAGLLLAGVLPHPPQSRRARGQPPRPSQGTGHRPLVGGPLRRGAQMGPQAALVDGGAGLRGPRRDLGAGQEERFRAVPGGGRGPVRHPRHRPCRHRPGTDARPVAGDRPRGAPAPGGKIPGGHPPHRRQGSPGRGGPPDPAPWTTCTASPRRCRHCSRTSSWPSPSSSPGRPRGALWRRT